MKFCAEGYPLAVQAVSFNRGQGKEGVDKGPEELIKGGLLGDLKKMGFAVEYSGKVEDFAELLPKSDPPHGVMKNPRSVGVANKKLSEGVYAQAKAGKFSLTLGGDHSIALGTISGSSRGVKERLGKQIGVIWVDAHADINTPDTSDSGNIHGMPLSFLLGLVERADAVPGFEWIKPCVEAGKLCYIGLRDVDLGERALLKKHNILAFSMHQIDKYGIGEVVERALKHVSPDGETPIHLSYDVDAMDPSIAPSTGTPVRGGLTFREGHYIAERLWESGLLVAMDMVEVNPLIGESFQATVSIASSLVRAGLGETLL